eukprot:scaffold1919_cov106-Isochrysis_galbana.AAC.3
MMCRLHTRPHSNAKAEPLLFFRPQSAGLCRASAAGAPGRARASATSLRVRCLAPRISTRPTMLRRLPEVAAIQAYICAIQSKRTQLLNPSPPKPALTLCRTWTARPVLNLDTHRVPHSTVRPPRVLEALIPLFPLPLPACPPQPRRWR